MKKIHDILDLMLIGIAHAFSDGYINLIVPVLALIVSDLQLSDVQVGLLLSSMSFSTFLFVFPVSLAADHTGKKLEFLVAGLAVASLAYFSMLKADSFIILTALAFLASAGNAVYHPCGTAITAERFYLIKPYAISVHGMMGNLGTSLIPFTMALIAQSFGWRWAIAGCTLPVLVILPAMWIRYHAVMKTNRSSRAAPGNDTASFKRNSIAIAAAVFRDRNVLILAVIYALSGLGTKTSIGFIPLLASRRFGLATAAIGIYMSVYFSMGIISKPVMGYIYSKFGARTALFIPLTISFFTTLFIGISPWEFSIIFLISIAGAANFISSVILTAASDYSDPKRLASSVGLIYSFHSIGFISPFIGGVLSEIAGLTAAYIFSSVFFIAGAFLSLSLKKPEKTI